MKTSQPSEKIAVFSLDWDGALAYNLAELRDISSPEKKLQQIVKDNTGLIKCIAALILDQRYTKVILMVGSNRQSWGNDFFAGFCHESTKGSGSCFPAYPEFKKALEAEIKNINTTPIVVSTAADVKTIESSSKPLPIVEFDDYLMADLYHSQLPGTAIKHANAAYEDPLKAERYFQEYRKLLATPKEMASWLKEKFYDKNTPGECLFDQTKITLLYTQMHRIASHYPDAEVNFVFLDDTQSILESLDAFYDKHKDLMPSNITFQWFLYHKGFIDFDDELDRPAIVGLGSIDFSYEDSILMWAAILLDITKPNNYGFFNEGSSQNAIDKKTDDNELMQVKVYQKIQTVIYDETHDETSCRHTSEVIELFKTMKNRYFRRVEEPETSSINVDEVEPSFSLG